MSFNIQNYTFSSGEFQDKKVIFVRVVIYPVSKTHKN